MSNARLSASIPIRAAQETSLGLLATAWHWLRYFPARFFLSGKNLKPWGYTLLNIDNHEHWLQTPDQTQVHQLQSEVTITFNTSYPDWDTLAFCECLATDRQHVLGCQLVGSLQDRTNKLRLDYKHQTQYFQRMENESIWSTSRSLKFSSAFKTILIFNTSSKKSYAIHLIWLIVYFYKNIAIKVDSTKEALTETKKVVSQV